MPTLPLKVYLGAILILIILIAFGWYTHHERAVQAAKDAAVDQKAIVLQEQRDTALQTTAALSTSIANGEYTREIQVPIADAPVPVGLCHTARGSSAVPNPASSDSGRATASVSGTEDAGSTAQLQQFADAAVEIARDADAQVTALQSANQALRIEMEKANAPK